MDLSDYDALVGETIAKKYVVERVLGAGGMGVVLAAHHKMTRRPVALKLLRRRDHWSGPIIERFLREARVAGSVQHPNIAEVLDAGVHSDGEPFLVMPLLDGEDVARRLEQTGPFSLERAAEVAHSLLEALEAAHERGVVHRDVKPENLFLSKDSKGRETIKLLDFGIAKVLRDESRSDSMQTLTEAGSILGTLDYMSPEQVRALPVDHRSDLWAVGVTMYRMLTGRLPFAGGSHTAVIFRIIAERFDPIDPSVPSSVRAWIHRALSKDPHDRFSSARKMRAALDEALATCTADSLPSRVEADVSMALAATDVAADRAIDTGTANDRIVDAVVEQRSESPAIDAPSATPSSESDAVESVSPIVRKRTVSPAAIVVASATAAIVVSLSLAGRILRTANTEQPAPVTNAPSPLVRDASPIREPRPALSLPAPSPTRPTPESVARSAGDGGVAPVSRASRATRTVVAHDAAVHHRVSSAQSPPNSAVQRPATPFSTNFSAGE